MSNAKPPAALKMKTPKLSISDLEAAYEWLPVSKETGLHLARVWYAENAPALLCNDPLSDDRKKAHERATKAFSLGEQGITVNERWTGFVTAIRLFESKVWPSKNLPKIDTALAAKAPKKYAKIAAFLEELGGLLGGLISITPTLEDSRRVVGNFSPKLVAIPVTEIETMLVNGALKTVVLEASFLAQAIASDANGNVNGDAFMPALSSILGRIAAHLASAKTVKFGTVPPAPAPVVVAPPPPPPPAPVAPIATGVGNATTHLLATDPFGRFRQGTAKAAVAATIASGAWVPMAELVAICNSMGITTGQIGVAFKQLTAHTGRQIEFRNGKAEVRIA